jgi:hypothetical protein
LAAKIGATSQYVRTGSLVAALDPSPQALTAKATAGSTHAQPLRTLDFAIGSGT